MQPSQLFIYTLAILIGSALLSYLYSFFSRYFAIQYRAIDMPATGLKKLHKEPVPLWGGAGIALALAMMVLLLAAHGEIFSNKLSPLQLVGFIVGIAILNFGGMLDDRFDLKPRWQMIFPVLAALAVIVTGTTIVQITNPGTGGGLGLDWFIWRPLDGWFRIIFPGDILTFIWLIVAMYATKISDGLDGLVTGLAVIGSLLVGALSATPAYFQPGSVMLAAAISGSFAGFLPKNLNPAKQFLGEGGSTMAGYCLGFLAIVSSAKVAIALAVLAIPIADVVFVALSRIRRGQPWYKGGDGRHLHNRLLLAGLSQRRTVLVIWAVSATAGIAALFLQTRGKLFLIGLVVLLTVLTSWVISKRWKGET